MFFQKVLKGINGVNQASAQQILDEGIMCNWWRFKNTITAAGIKEQLVDNNIVLHLNHYDNPLPTTHPLYPNGGTYGNVTPFISTTAGSIQRDALNKVNILFPPFITALRFATNNFKSNGFIFYAYLITLGKKAVPLEQFSEEVRELHIYTNFLPYHHEGEIMGKIIIPSVQIEKAEEYNGPQALADLRGNIIPTPIIQLNNLTYQQPEDYSNIREVL